MIILTLSKILFNKTKTYGKSILRFKLFHIKKNKPLCSFTPYYGVDCLSLL